MGHKNDIYSEKIIFVKDYMENTIKITNSHLIVDGIYLFFENPKSN